jgi:hypothetical protein
MKFANVSTATQTVKSFTFKEYIQAVRASGSLPDLWRWNPAWVRWVLFLPYVIFLVVVAIIATVVLIIVHVGQDVWNFLRYIGNLGHDLHATWFGYNPSNNRW